jgi:5-methylthioribose kinase
MILDVGSKEVLRAYLIEKGLIGIKESVKDYLAISTTVFCSVYKFSTNKNFLIIKQGIKNKEHDKQNPDLAKRMIRQEANFYKLTRSYDYLSRFMTEFYLLDEENDLIITEEVPESTSYYSVYKSHHISQEELYQLIKWLSHLHRVRVQPTEKALLEHEGIQSHHASRLFDFPERLEYNIHDPFASEIKRLQEDITICKAIQYLKDQYLEPAFTLVHGNYTPGNWLGSDGSIYIIDPSYAAFSKPEIDLGMLIGHLLLASVNRHQLSGIFDYYENDNINKDTTLQLAGLEIIRYLIGSDTYSHPGTPSQRKSKLKEGFQLLLGARKI